MEKKEPLISAEERWRRKARQKTDPVKEEVDGTRNPDGFVTDENGQSRGA
jgi:hypothetical protein